jgi:beta-N-acetylhexosaminidase
MEERGDSGAAPGRRREDRRERRRVQARQAEVRRRRVRALGVVGGVAALLGAVVGAGAGDEPPPPAEASIPAQCAGSDRSAVRSIAGQRLIVRTDAVPDRGLLERVRAGEIAGVIVFPGLSQDEDDVRAGAKQLQRAASAGSQPPLIVATDQEGGEVKRFSLAPPQRSPFQLREIGDAGDSRLEGKATGAFLEGVGINTDLAPVLDVDAVPNSVIHFRAFGDDPEKVSKLGLAFADGLARNGVLATAKHFPGLGRSALNTDLAPSAIDAPRRVLLRELRPFRDAIADGIPLVMVGLASYPALGGRKPAALDPRIADDLLRGQLGYDGVTITDDLQAGAVAASYDSKEAAVQAAKAGNDLLLFAQDAAPGALDALAGAITRARVDIASARRSCVRVVELRQSLER